MNVLFSQFCNFSCMKAFRTKNGTHVPLPHVSARRFFDDPRLYPYNRQGRLRTGTEDH